MTEQNQTFPNGEPNSEIKLASQIIEKTSQNLYLTGKAGTGKTTFLKWLKESSTKRMIILAPTGIAAINAGGMTIHSFFHFPLSPFIPHHGFPDSKRNISRFNKDKIQIIKTLDLLVIDEVSMVRADILDAIDATLRRFRDHSRPFGGVQLLLIGDLQQLSPVVKQNEWQLLKDHYSTPYFFSSIALQEAGYLTVELKKVYRQSDEVFLNLLGKIRRGEATSEVIAELNRRYIPDFKPSPDKGYIRLTTHNHLAEEINRRELELLPGEAISYSAQVDGDFPEMLFPTSSSLTLKKDAQVMFLRNDNDKGYYNGMTGKIVALSEKSVTVRPIGKDHNIEVETTVWETSKYTLDEESGEIKEDVVGFFRQLPLKPAWAITIHKSQGLTFDNAIIDASLSFAHGQTYVALSRCRSLEGMVLEKPLSVASVIIDPVVESFYHKHSCDIPDEDRLNHLKNEYLFECLDSLFSFIQLRKDFDQLHRIASEYLHRDYPILLQKFGHVEKQLKEFERISESFSRQYRSLNVATPMFAERISKGCTYFAEHIAPFTAVVDETPKQTDNKTVTSRLDTILSTLKEALFIKQSLLKAFKDYPFTANNFLKAKSKAVIEYQKTLQTKKTGRERKNRQTAMSADIVNPALYEALQNWRRLEMAERNVPAFVIAPNRALIWIAANMPRTIKHLAETPGIGKKKIQEYGQILLSIVEDYITPEI